MFIIYAFLYLISLLTNHTHIIFFGKIVFFTLANNRIKMYQDSGKKHMKPGAIAAPLHMFKPNL